MNNQFDVNPPEPTGDWIHPEFGLWALLVIIAICVIWTWVEQRPKDDPKTRDFCAELPRKRLKMDAWRWEQEAEECRRQGYSVTEYEIG